MSLVAYEDSDLESEGEQNDGEMQKNVKPKQPVKILAPSLDYDSDDEPCSKKHKLDGHTTLSGLLSMLPPPKEQPEKVLTLVPNILKKKPSETKHLNNTKGKVQNNGTVKKVQNSEVKKAENGENTAKEESDEDEDSDDDVPLFDEELWKKIVAPPKRKSTFATTLEHPNLDNSINDNNGLSPQEVQIAPEPEKPYQGLDNAAFKELVGRSKRKQENINIIDIHEDEIRPEKEEWLKSLTDPTCAPKKVVENPVNDTCRRKHHITYLAQQAKANELELQNQWSQNRFARKQTQAKYGF